FCRTALLKQYRYNPLQSQAEDYDLWLRLQAANIPICKITEPLVLHRIVKNSFTRKRQQNVFKKNAQTKRRFVYGQWKKKQFSTFELTVFIYSLSDSVKGLLKPLKAFLTEK